MSLWLAAGCAYESSPSGERSETVAETPKSLASTASEGLPTSAATITTPTEAQPTQSTEAPPSPPVGEAVQSPVAETPTQERSTPSPMPSIEASTSSAGMGTRIAETIEKVPVKERPTSLTEVPSFLPIEETVAETPKSLASTASEGLPTSAPIIRTPTAVQPTPSTEAPPSPPVEEALKEPAAETLIQERSTSSPTPSTEISPEKAPVRKQPTSLTEVPSFLPIEEDVAKPTAQVEESSLESPTASKEPDGETPPPDEPSSSPWPETAYHVDGTYQGDESDGTKEHPWKMISEAAAFPLKPGDWVVVHAGTYRESLRLKHQGTKDEPITFFADGEVIIKGSETVADWQAKGGCVYSHKNWIYKEPYPLPGDQVDTMLYGKLVKDKKDYAQDYKNLGVTVSWEYNKNKQGDPYEMAYDIKITNWDKGIDFLRKEFPDILYSLGRHQVFAGEKPLREVMTPGALKPGTFYIEPKTKELSVCLADSSDPADHDMEGSVRDSLVRFHRNSSSIVFKGFKLRHATSPIVAHPWLSENAVELAGTNHVFENNEIKDVNGQGLTVIGHPNQPSPIAPNYDYAESDYADLMKKTHLGHLIKGNTIERSGFNGVTSTLTNGVRFYDNTVRFNSLRSRFLFEGWAAGGIKLASCQNWDINNLKAYYNYYHALWFDTACFGHKIQNSVFYGNYAAVRLEGCNGKTPEQGNLISGNVIYSNVEGVDWTGGGHITVANNLIAYNDTGMSIIDNPVSPGPTNKVMGNLITDHENIAVGYTVYAGHDTLFDNNLYYGIVECHYPTPDCGQLSYWARWEALEADINSQGSLSAEEKEALVQNVKYLHGKPNWNAHLALMVIPGSYYIKTLEDWRQATEVWSKSPTAYYDYENLAKGEGERTAYYKGTYPSESDATQWKTVPIPDQYKSNQFKQIPLKPDPNSVYADPKYLDPVHADFCLAPDSIARVKKIGPAALHSCSKEVPASPPSPSATSSPSISSPSIQLTQSTGSNSQPMKIRIKKLFEGIFGGTDVKEQPTAQVSLTEPETPVSPTPVSKESEEPPSCDDDLFHLMGHKFLWSLDFEDLDDRGWMRGWDRPRVQVPGKKIPTIEMDASVKRSGQRSLKISAADPNVTAGSMINPVPLPVKPGERYTISFWIKGTDVVSQTGHMAVLQTTSKAKPGGAFDYSQSAYWFAAYPTQPSTYDWKQVVGTFTVPANQDAMSLMILFQNGAGTVWLDDIVVMPTKAFEALAETTLEVETRTTEPAAPAHHYFLRDRPIEAKAVLRNQKGAGGTYTVKMEWSSCGQILQQTQKTATVTPHGRIEVPLMTLDPSRSALGDYLLTVKLEQQDGQIVDSVSHPVGLRQKPDSPFLFSIGFAQDLDPSSALARMDKYKSHHITPLFYGGEPSAFAADAALSRDMPFIVRLMPDMAFPKKKRPDGGDFPVYPDGLSDEKTWSARAQQIGEAVKRIGHFPAFFPRIFTNDDFSIIAGWDWADRNKERFKLSTGMEAPVPAEFAGQANPFAVEKLAKQKGAVESDEPWLAYNRFLSKDVLGAHNKAVATAVVQANTDARIGPIQGGMQWPLFASTMAQYPPANFGDNGFNMISYYMYLMYWRPLIAYVYWTDIGRMGNRDLPFYVMPDAFFPEPSYHWNNFYLLLASGVNGLAYFIDNSTADQPYVTGGVTPEFWETAKSELGPLAEKFGSLFAQLKPEPKKVGLLASFTASTYNTTHPLHLLCAYGNLLMSHVDVETVSEEEILDGRLSQYDALILSDVDWLRSDVVKLLNESTQTKIILDQSSEIPLSGNNIHKVNFNLVEGNCGPNGDYGKADRLATIRTELNKIVSPSVVIDQETVIHRKYAAEGKQYLWLVDVHTGDEYNNLWNIVTSEKYGLDQPEHLEAIRSKTKQYLQKQGVYGGSTAVAVKVKTDQPASVADVLTGQKIEATYNQGWTTFQTTIERLKGKLISF